MPPSTSIFAPMRTNSGTCMKRFSKMVSEIRDAPSARHIIAINCACKSVGKPGKGSVLMSDAFILSEAVIVRSEPVTPGVSVTSAPPARNTSISASRWRGSDCFKVKEPLVIAAAMAKVPASIRSATTRCVAPSRLSTPSIVMVSVPWPVIFAPILFRHSARSDISGSRAAFTNSDVPLASTAAIIAFSVAPTDTIGNTICPPRRPFGARA